MFFSWKLFYDGPKNCSMTAPKKSKNVFHDSQKLFSDGKTFYHFWFLPHPAPCCSQIEMFPNHYCIKCQANPNTQPRHNHIVSGEGGGKPRTDECDTHVCHIWGVGGGSKPEVTNVAFYFCSTLSYGCHDGRHGYCDSR